MKLPCRPSFSPSRPAWQAGQPRGSPPSARAGKKCAPRSWSSASITSPILRSRVCSTARENSLPERPHHRAPVGPAAGDVVELLLERGGEAGVDVALEEAGQERGDEPAAVLRDEALVLQPHVVAVPQHGQDAGVGGGAADAELLHLLDQARLRVARRRLGEVLVGGDPVAASAGRARPSAAACGSRRRRRPAASSTSSRYSLRKPSKATMEPVARSLVPAAGDLDRDLVELGRLHLAGDGALPDQLVEAELLG